jgi:hypothetical protein
VVVEKPLRFTERRVHRQGNQHPFGAYQYFHVTRLPQLAQRNRAQMEMPDYFFPA